MWINSQYKGEKIFYSGWKNFDSADLDSLKKALGVQIINLHFIWRVTYRRAQIACFFLTALISKLSALWKPFVVSWITELFQPTVSSIQSWAVPSTFLSSQSRLKDNQVTLCVCVSI